MADKHSKKIRQLLIKEEHKLQDLTKKKYNILSLKEERQSENRDIDFKINDNFSFNIEDEENNILKEEKQLNNRIADLRSVEKFAKKIDDNVTVSYVDGHLTSKENRLFETYISFDNSLYKKIESMKRANSFFGKIEDDYKEPDVSILANVLELIEKKEIKKNELNLARETFKKQNLISKLKEWITLKPIEFGFAGLTPIMIGAGLMYGTTTAVVATNPAIIQLAQLSNYSTTSIITNVSGPIFRNECLPPSTTLNTNDFNSVFNLKAYNPLTKKNYNLSNNDQTLLGNQIQLFFKTNIEGKIFIDVLDRSNTTSKCNYINIIEQQINTVTADFIKIGRTLPITEPLGKDKILVKFKEENNDQINNLGIFNLTTISTDKLEKNYLTNPINLEKSQDFKVLPKKEIYQLHSNIFKKELYKPFVQSWGNNEFKTSKFERIFIDFDGDNKAEIVALDADKDGSVDSYVIDRNNNAVIDAVVFPLNKDGKLVYEWFLDNNEDKKFDAFAQDLSGNWQINKINDL